MPAPYSRRYSPSNWGDFHAVGSRGQRYGLIGHESVDVWAWLDTRPDFDGSIFFDLCDGGDEVDVTDEFINETLTWLSRSTFDGNLYLTTGNSRGSVGILATDEDVDAFAQSVVEARVGALQINQNNEAAA